jgi:hypothetical protein
VHVKVRLSQSVEESDFCEIGHAARLRGLSVAEWVRRSVRAELDRERESAVTAKLEAVRRAAKHSFPSGDIAQMLAEMGSS